jgi:hypothetical protein
VLVARSMDPGWLSNTYLVADDRGGTALFVESGAPLEPLLQQAGECGVTPSHVLRTHTQGKAWVRFDGGTDALVGGSRAERP